MKSLSLLLVVLVAECYCAPWKSGGGFNLGGHSEIDFAAGGKGKISRDGMAFTGTGNGILGAKWRGEGYGGGYANINDKYVGGRVKGRSTLGGYLKPRLTATGGFDGKGGVPLEFSPGLKVDKVADVNGNFELSYGDDAKRTAALYGDFGADKEEFNH